ncbi:DNA polymerase I [Ameyamaea chiangmaiensis NBRC 103196]|uniref:DNA polymerase I n=1 Tax=Ameyamaea chiangmaiensis TaxID=442969 RepID=A0A850P8H7_9PROT|nr:DNA polymerase I [Ameyamaea chiangmaiensis]MBS4074118.1 DNA polymerase I [Ameyamaea chiangmaiensis]NVN40897.1 DNA polymerase I [Ameyamaea chiangmaiensis]GBQ70948.1 DNA polymerase I [Ameyamaea chiangmaiensis NBRC 103196]
MTQESSPRHLVLVDGSGFIFRAFHALPPMHSPDGTPVNAVYGFTNMLTRLMRDHVGTHLAVIFDANRRTFRNDLYADYKAHRPEPPEDLRPQFALVRDAARALAVPSVELEGWEADDLLAAYARHMVETGGRCTIVSSDKDLMQLIRPGVELLDPIKQKPITAAEVDAKFGVSPDKVVDVQALMGDSVDNVPGVPGIGPKTASALIAEFGDLDSVLAAAEGMKPSKRRDNLLAHADAARMSRDLVRLRDDAPLPLSVDAMGCHEPDGDELAAWLETMGFRSLSQRLGMKVTAARGSMGRPASSPAPTPVPTVDSAPYTGYETVTDAAALEVWVARARDAGVCAVDTETSGLDPLACELVGVSLAVAPGQACYIPLRHDGDLEHPVGAQIPAATCLDILRSLLADPAVLKVFQNAKFDLLVLGRAGVETIAPVDDTMLISYAQSAGAHGQGMDELSQLHLGHAPITYDAVTGTGRNRVPFSRVDLRRATDYAAEDADVTLRLWQVLRPQLRPNRALALYEEMERPLIGVLADMERAGIAVDAQELRRMSADFAVRMEAIEGDLHRLAGRSFNVGSPKQLGEILFDEMGLPGGKRMKSGAWGTDSSVLQELAEQGHELPEKILDWRQLAKLKSTYADALVGQINPETGRVHTSFQMAVTSTGRLSSNEPNLQNIPIRTEEGGRIRRAFVAQPGHVLVSADYSQIELRLLADAADIAPLREAFALGQDIHARTASEVFGIPLDQLDARERRRAKAINFGIIYGISAFGLARQLKISPGEARSYIDAYFARYPGIRDFMERMKEEARAKGYVTTALGRRCYVPGIAERNGARRAYAERQAINAPLQGGAADIIKRAMVRLSRDLACSDLRAQMLLQVHDELLFEVAEGDAPALADLVRGVMEGAASLSVPLVVETGIGANWADAH